MCFVLCLYLDSLSSSSAQLSSLNTDECVMDVLLVTLSKVDNSSRIPLSGIISLMLWLNAIYSASVVDNAFSVCILLTHKNGQLK